MDSVCVLMSEPNIPRDREGKQGKNGSVKNGQDKARHGLEKHGHSPIFLERAGWVDSIVRAEKMQSKCAALGGSTKSPRRIKRTRTHIYEV